MRDAFQDHYPDDVAHCYGCGRLNDHGLHVRSRWDGDDAVCTFRPQPYHVAFPGYVYGGLIASLIDCHSMGTAAAAWMRARGLGIGEVPTARFVTGRLEVDYLAPTPIGVELTIRARAADLGERKVVIEAEVVADGRTTARGRTIAIRMPDHLVPD